MKIASRLVVPGVVVGALLLQQTALADASYQETTQITGGSLVTMMKMASIFSSKARGMEKPIVSTVMVHGNKMVRVQPTDTQIIDLDNQTITNIDTEKHLYSVMTFDQMKQAMNDAAAKAKEQKQTQPADSKDPNVQVSFHANVTSSGATKQIEGQEAKQALMTLTMDAQPTDQTKSDGQNANASLAVASEMWLIQEAKGYDEIRDFNMRMAKLIAANLDTSAISGMLRSQPGASDAMADLQKESYKLKGIPVEQFTRMGMTMNGQPLPPPTEAEKAGSSGSPGNNSNKGASEGLASLGRMMGNSSLGGFMRHKKSQNTEQPPSSSSQSSSQNEQAAPGAATLVETKTTMSNFSSDPVDSSKFEVPAGYKKVEAAMQRGRGSN